MARSIQALDCPDCGKTVVRRSAMQKYCETCSAARHVETKRRSRLKRGRPKETEEQRQRRVEKQHLDRDHQLARGRKISAAHSTKMIGWMGGNEPSLHSVFRFKFPFAYCMSKNGIWSNAAGGSHVFVRRKARDARSKLTAMIANAVASHRIYQGKVWIDLFVQKPDHRGDAVNVIDLVCDALKDGIGVDDKWFSIRRVDWEIAKVDPHVFVGFGQEITEDHRICSYCGRALPISTGFPADSQKSVRRECLDCRSSERTEALVSDLRGNHHAP